MKYPKKLIFAAASAGVIGAAGIGATAIAVSGNDSSSYPPIVQKIASTFGLDPAKVNDVFKQQHQDNLQDRQAKLKSTLDQAVKDGKLTQDQETKLIAEMQTLRSQLKSGSQTSRRQNMQEFKTQLDQWAKDNGINNLDQILPKPGTGTGVHNHMMDNDGDADDSASNPSSN
jgi:outer membrane scaffolding protein for murein synthesis (MipA/OmpV family)